MKAAVACNFDRLWIGWMQWYRLSAYISHTTSHLLIFKLNFTISHHLRIFLRIVLLKFDVVSYFFYLWKAKQKKTTRSLALSKNLRLSLYKLQNIPRAFVNVFWVFIKVSVTRILMNQEKLEHLDVCLRFLLLLYSLNLYWIFMERRQPLDFTPVLRFVREKTVHWMEFW